MSDFIICAYEIKKEGAKSLDRNEIVSGLKSDVLAWVHLDAGKDETHKWLETEIAFLDPFIVSALTAEETRPRISPIAGGVLLILRGMNFNDLQEDEDMVAVRLYADSERIISLERRSVRTIVEIADELKAGHGPKDTSEFVSTLVYKMSRGADMAVASLDDTMDETERMMVESTSVRDIRRDLSDIRMKSIKIRRHLAPQREALFELKSLNVKWLSDIDKRAIHESYNRTVRAVEELDAIRERAQIIKDEISNQLGEKLNRNTYVLSLIAAIFLPLGFLTGLFGINIGGLPGIENPNAFWLFCAFMTILVACQIVIFKKLKWF